MIQRIVTFCLLPSCLSFLTVFYPAKSFLLQSGKSDYQVVVPDKYASDGVSASIFQTARLIQTTFAANGAEIPITPESKLDPKKPGIYLGNTLLLKNQNVDVESLIIGAMCRR